MRAKDKEVPGLEVADEDYDPHLHREVKKPTNYVQTLANILKACIGTGILAMPEAFKNSGIYLGIISTVVIGMLCTYCLHVLVRSQYVICKKLKVPLLRYPESMQAAFEIGPTFLNKGSRFGFHMTNLVLIIYQLGNVCVYYVFISVSLKELIDPYLEEPFSLVTYMAFVFVPFFAILTIRNFKVLAPFSIVAMLISFITFGVIFYFVFQNMPSFGDIPSEATPKTYALYFGTTLFAVQSIGVVTSAEQNMAEPKSFRKPFGVLNVAMAIITSLYIFMGLVGYWRYCIEGIQSSITLNLPKEETVAKVTNIMYTIAIYISCGLQGYTAVYLVWHGCIQNKVENWSQKKQILLEYLLRFLCALIAFAASVSIPMLGLIISLVGSFGLTILGFIFPALIETCAYWPDELGRGKWTMWKDILIILVGLIGLCCGTFACIYDLISYYKEKAE